MNTTPSEHEFVISLPGGALQGATATGATREEARAKVADLHPDAFIHPDPTSPPE